MPETIARPESTEQHTPQTSPERAPEAGREKQFEQPTGPSAIEQTRTARPQQGSAQHIDRAHTAESKDQELVGIESILAEGLEGFFLSLSKPQQLEFKRIGEETALKIKETLHRKAMQIKDIVLLIINWLKTLPGINKFFLEQEAKIKADKIVSQFRS